MSRYAMASRPAISDTTPVTTSIGHERTKSSSSVRARVATPPTLFLPDGERHESLRYGAAIELGELGCLLALDALR